MSHPSLSRQQAEKHRLQPTVLQLVNDRLNSGIFVCQIYGGTEVARTTITRIRLSLEYWGEPYPPPCVRQGRPRKLLQYHRDQLKELLLGKLNTYLDGMQAFLYDEFDHSVSLATIWDALESTKWSRKVASKVATERHDVLRRAFKARCKLGYQSE